MWNRLTLDGGEQRGDERRPDRDDGVAAGKLSAWILLAGFMFVTAAARAVYSSHGRQPSARFELLCALGLLSLLWYWFSEQCRPYRLSFPLDMGLFVAALWIVLLPYYLWRHERWKGCVKALALLTIHSLAYASSVAFHYLLVAIP